MKKSVKVHNHTLSKPQSPLFDHTVPGELRDYFVHILCSGLPRYIVACADRIDDVLLRRLLLEAVENQRRRFIGAQQTVKPLGCRADRDYDILFAKLMRQKSFFQFHIRSFLPSRFLLAANAQLF